MTDRYLARPVSDMIGCFFSWMVVDTRRGNLNVTHALLRAYVGDQAKAMFVSPPVAECLAILANAQAAQQPGKAGA